MTANTHVGTHKESKWDGKKLEFLYTIHRSVTGTGTL